METFAPLIYCIIDHALLQATPDIHYFSLCNWYVTSQLSRLSLLQSVGR